MLIRRFIGAVISGVFYALAYPPLGWGWLVVPAFAGLLISLHGQSGTRARALGFTFGMSAAGASLIWLYQIFGFFAAVLWCVIALFPALFTEFQGRPPTQRPRPPTTRPAHASHPHRSHRSRVPHHLLHPRWLDLSLPHPRQRHHCLVVPFTPPNHSKIPSVISVISEISG